LNTLAPGTWLNDNVIDVMTQVLAGRAVTESRRKVAVFDTQFTKLILEQPATGKGSSFYVYEKAVGVAEKRLLGRSPLYFDCLLFPNGINSNHWTIIAVFPKELLIVALDSLRIGSVTDARIICRWLYDEMNYKHPADANTLFQPYQRDLGWKYTVDTEITVQGDVFNCGVFMVGYFHCPLFGMNPRHLTPALMEEYRKFIFGAMHGAKVVEFGPSSWMAYNPVKRIQDPLPALANAVSRSIKNKRRGTRILDFDVFKKTSERLRNVRAEEQKQRRDARVLKLAADAIVQRKMDESAKMQTQNIEVADGAVDILMLGGLGC
jgi:hypothetical protein